MTRLGMVAAAAATLAAVVLAPTVGQAQSVDAAARDLRTHDVTFEDGAVTDQDIADLDRVTAQLQADGGYTKVVVLAHPVDTSSSARAFAGKVLDTLGGRGRVIVFDPRDVGIATNVPGEASKVNSAELAAIDAANRSNSFATGVLGAADTLGVTGSAGSGTSTGSNGGSGGQDLGAPGGSTGSILPTRAPRGRRGAGRRRVLLLVVVAPSARLPPRRRASPRPRASRPCGVRSRRLEPGHRPGRSDRGPRRAGRGGHRVP